MVALQISPKFHKHIVVIILQILLLLGMEAWAGTAMASVKIELNPQPNPPEAGENKLTIQLLNEQGQAIDDARLGILVSMPAMGTMPYMEAEASVKPKGKGLYEAVYFLSMGGTWEMELSIGEGEQKKSYRYSVTTGIPGIKDKNRARSAGDDGKTTLMDIGPDRLQMIGVRFALVKSMALEKIIRTVGVVEQDKTHREEISLRFPGYLVKQFRGRVGDYVKKGEPLFSIYSPELVTAQSEFLLAHDFIQDSHIKLRGVAAERLKNLGLSEIDIRQIKKTGKPIRDIVIRSPLSGTILEINAREGATIGAGQVLYIVGDLSKSYIVARVFQQDLGELSVGQAVEVAVPYTGESYMGKIDLVYPQIEKGAGTGNVRVEVDQYVKEIRPGSYVDLRFPIKLGTNLVIPSEAVLYSGLHRYVFVDHGQGNLEPREIKTGKRSGDQVVVREGLEEGERVAASGTFLLSSEAQLRSALPKWKAGQTGKASPIRDEAQQDTLAKPGSQNQEGPAKAESPSRETE